VSQDLRIPADFQKIIKDLVGTESDSFFKSLHTPSPASIRLNPHKHFDQPDSLDIPWTKWGKYLKERPIYTLDPLLHAGAYYVQEPSSMFLEHVIKHSIEITTPIIALDLCAAPGGKSTHLLSLLHPESLLVSNEVIRSRASILSENIQKWGYANTLVTNNDPSHFTQLEGLFDLIVVDAPCSGEGLFRKDNEALNQWSESNVELCSLRQQRILKDVWPALKQGGILIYSTCTYNTKEDEANMEWLSKKEDLEFLSVPLSQQWGIMETRVRNTIGYKFYPHKVNGEGFFISAVRKQAPQKCIRIHTKEKLWEASKAEREISGWLKNSEQFKIIKNKDTLSRIPTYNFPIIEFLSHQLNPILTGVPLAILKHGKFVPEHSSSLSVQLDRHKFPMVELSYDDAIRYLRKDPLKLSLKETGFTLVAFKKNPLGWVNILPNRINNLYPANWRIRMKAN